MHVVAESLDATWSPFVLVAGLLLIGHVAADEGLFRLVGSWCARAPGGGRGLFVLTMLAVAGVSAVLNLDTSVVFMTPVAISAARAKGTDINAFLYGTIFMTNSASLLLVGSNLTNLLIFAHRGESGSAFAQHTALAWLAALAVTIAVVGAWRWRALGLEAPAAPRSRVVARFGPGMVAVGLAMVVMVAVARPAIWVFAAGAAAELCSLLRVRGSWRAVLRALNLTTLVPLFLVAVGVGWFARWSSVTRHLLTHTSAATTAIVAAGSSLVINNLPAASLFGAHSVEHPFALLAGLDFGPNCAITGALSSLLWLRIARRHQLRPSLVVFSMVGTLVAAGSIASALALF